jgi:stage IV sporulation protein FB
MLTTIRARFASLGHDNAGLFFPLLGFPVRINRSFWLLPLVGLAYYQSRSGTALLAWMGALTAAILIHELGHAIVASRWAVVTGITLHGAGGATTWMSPRALRPVSWPQHVAICLAGPGAGLLLAAVLHALPRPEGELAWLLMEYLIAMNVALALFNLLPTQPLDGGQVTRVVLTRFWATNADFYGAAIGMATVVAASIVAIAWEQPWTLLVLAFCGLYNFEALRERYQNRSRSQWAKPSEADRIRDRY